MRSIAFILIGLCGLLSFEASAQTSTNLPDTQIENFELRTDTVIVKGFTDIGSVTTGNGVVSVRCKESDDETTGQKLYGISVALDSNSSRGFLVVDYDELDPLTHGLDFLQGISYDVTTMSAFDAGLATRSGLRVGAHSERRQGTIQIYLQFNEAARIALTSDQFSQFRNLIIQAKTSLDTAKEKNSST
jgi:hypothetical protein